MARADITIVAMGPGVVGTTSALGTSAIEVAAALDAAAALGGQPIACVRASGADQRPRHRGVSHHTTTALELVRSPIRVPVPPALADDPVATEVVPSPDVAALLDGLGLQCHDDGSRPGRGSTLLRRRGRCRGACRRPTVTTVSADKLERLLNLTALLLDTGHPLSRETIRERLPGYADGDEAFRRQFERDKDDLRRMGIPLVVEPVPGQLPEIDGYRIPADHYYLADPGLRPDELTALHLAASAVRVEGLPSAEGLRKLGVGPQDGGADEPVGVHIAALPGDANLGVLFGAVSAHQPVELGYRGETRRVDPYRLELRRGRWYLWGHDHGRGEARSYRLDRIEGTVRALDEPAFEPRLSGRPGSEREPWELGEGDPVTARVRIDGPPATWALHHLGPEAVVEQDDDGVVVELEVVHRDGFRTFVLSFLDHAEVLSPPELRDEIVTWLTELAGEPAP